MNWLRWDNALDFAQRAGQMSPRRVSLLLITILCLASGSRGDQANNSSRFRSVEAFAQIHRSEAGFPSVWRTSTNSTRSSWRFRLKSVLQDSDHRITEESDLGPVPMPEHFFSLVGHIRESGPSRPSVPLRC
jgi:hypothetical protein